MTFCLYLLLWIKTEMYFWETGELHHSFVSPLRVCVFWKLLCSKVFKTEVSDPLLLSGCSPTESRSSVLVNTVVQYFFFKENKMTSWNRGKEGGRGENRVENKVMGGRLLFLLASSLIPPSLSSPSSPPVVLPVVVTWRRGERHAAATTEWMSCVLSAVAEC